MWLLCALSVWMCISGWKSEIGVCGYQCKYIVCIISFYAFVWVITVQVPFQAGG